MIEWWGPIIHEYYGATEGTGLHRLRHRRNGWRIAARSAASLLGELHVLDDAMTRMPTGTPGTLWFETATPFEYFNDPAQDGRGALAPTAR